MRSSPEKYGSLHALDKKGGGREIKGLLPKKELFSRLDPGRDIADLKKNKYVTSNTDLDHMYYFVNPRAGTKELLVQAPHWRTISQDNIKATFDREGMHEFYYTVNVKGVGYLKPTLRGRSIESWDEWNRIDENDYPGGFGLAGRDDFITEEGDLIAKSQNLTTAGLRTELYYSFGRLKNVYYKGRLTSIKDLRKQKIIPNKQQFVPHIGVRLLKNNTRIAEVKEHDAEYSRQLFKKAFAVHNQEIADKKLNLPLLELGDAASEIRYFVTFFQRMGKNMAIFNNLGYIGWQLHSANVTLAAEIVDISPYQSWRVDKDDPQFVKKFQGVRRGSWKDFRDIAYDLRILLQAGQKNGLAMPNRTDLVQEFMSTFSSNLRNTALRRQRVKRADLEHVCLRILSAVLIERRRLAALKHGADITDWNIPEQ